MRKSKKPSLLCQRAIKKLPQHNFCVGKAMRAAGYSARSSRAGHHIARVREGASQFWSEEAIKEEIEDHLLTCKAQGDLGNVSRMLELTTKCLGLQHPDQSNTKPTTIVIVDRTSPAQPVTNTNA